MLNNSDLYNTDCFHNVSCCVNYDVSDCEPGNTEEFPCSLYLSTLLIKIFYTMNLGMFHIKLGNQLIAIVYHIPNIYQWQNTTYLFIVLKQKCYLSSCPNPMLTWVLTFVTHYIPNTKRMTSERFILCIHIL